MKNEIAAANNCFLQVAVFKEAAQFLQMDRISGVGVCYVYVQETAMIISSFD